MNILVLLGLSLGRALVRIDSGTIYDQSTSSATLSVWNDEGFASRFDELAIYLKNSPTALIQQDEGRRVWVSTASPPSEAGPTS